VPTEQALIAEGWSPLPTVRYSAAVGPTFDRMVDGRLQVALLADNHLANDNLGIVHGGAIMTFADLALGRGVGALTGHHHFVTAQMQFHFVAAASVGQLVTCEPEVVRATSQLVFMRGLFVAGGRTVASADGMFKLLDAEKVDRLKAG